MGREKRSIPAAAAGGPKERHKRAQKSQYDPKAVAPPGLVARKQLPAVTKHHSYFEIVENVDKKEKPLDFQVTDATTEHPGYTFVPIGNPELTKECKELTREKGAMVFIVSTATADDPNYLPYHVHRTGHKFRDTIVEEARRKLSLSIQQTDLEQREEVNAMPTSQAEYFRQADLTVRDLFPRIPNPDRQRIVSHAFNMNAPPPENQREPRVGLSWKLTLARRVQLAVLAHIRHTHTRYDQLLKETSWQNARKAVEPVCLDILVKWRGDDETGRDQLDEILREVVVISDSEDDESSDEHEAGGIPAPFVRDVDTSARQNLSHETTTGFLESARSRNPSWPQDAARSARLAMAPRNEPRIQSVQSKGHLERKQQRGFKRYQRAWRDAVQRRREHGSQTRVLSAMEVTVPSAGAYIDEVNRRPLDENAGAVPHPNGYVPRLLDLGTPIGIRTFPPQPSGPILLPRDPMSAISPPVTNPARAMQERSSMANRLQDLLVRSVEPQSPESMAPAFVRALPPRSQPSTTLRPQMQPAVSPRPSPQHRLVYDDRLGRNSDSRYEDQYPQDLGAQSHAAPNIVTWQHEGRRCLPHNGRDRLVEEGPRSGSQSNPITMVDMGGFFQRVTRPDGGFVASLDYAESRPLGPSNSLYASNAHRALSREDGTRTIREHHEDADLQVVPMTGSCHYSPMAPSQHTHTAAVSSRVIYCDDVQYQGQQTHSTYDGAEMQGCRGALIAPRAYTESSSDMYARQSHSEAAHYVQPPSSAYPPTIYLPRGERQYGNYAPVPRAQEIHPNNVVVLD